MASTNPVHAGVVIVGGGNAGISLAAYLRRQDRSRSICLIAPEFEHLYRPLLSYVGGGLCDPRRTRHDQAALIPPGVEWVRDAVMSVGPADPANGKSHTVATVGGRVVAADDLVLCPGTVIDWDAIPGSREACRSAHASTNYDPDLAPKTWDVMKRLDGGTAVFLVSNRNTPCPGVGLKPLFLAADHWRQTGRLGAIDIVVVLEGDHPTGLAAADERILGELNRLGATVVAGAHIDAVDASGRFVSLRGRDGRPVRQHYDAMHLAPPFRGHQWLIDAELTDPATGLVANDPLTLAHPDHPGIWALGDAATLATPTSGGGLRHQVPVVARNILARRAGSPNRTYDGYTVAPVPISRSSLLLAERDRAGREVRSISSVSLAQPRRSLFAFDLWVQPWVYWHRLLRGQGLDD